MCLKRINDAIVNVCVAGCSYNFDSTLHNAFSHSRRVFPPNYRLQWLRGSLVEGGWQKLFFSFAQRGEVFSYYCESRFLMVPSRVDGIIFLRNFPKNIYWPNYVRGNINSAENSVAEIVWTWVLQYVTFISFIWYEKLGLFEFLICQEESELPMVDWVCWNGCEGKSDGFDELFFMSNWRVNLWLQIMQVRSIFAPPVLN